MPEAAAVVVVPKLDQVVRLSDALLRFGLTFHQTGPSVLDDEERLLPAFVEAVEAAGPLRGRIEIPADWPYQVGQAIEGAVAFLDEWIARHGWGAVAGPDRDEHITRARERFRRENVEPILAAARGWAEAVPFAECPRPVQADANEARRLGIPPAPDLGRLPELYREAGSRVANCPCFGTAPPSLDVTGDR